jgi:hypothetical protein
MIQSKDEIIVGLRNSFGELITHIQSLDTKAFESTPLNKWSAGQQLEHLIKSVRPINLVLFLPHWLIKSVFGKMNREPRTFEILLKKYHDKLALGGTASSPFVPSVIPFIQKEKLIKRYNSHLDKLCKHVESLTENDLDTIVLPHPLLGKVCLREMMYFTIFHTQHHLKSIKER